MRFGVAYMLLEALLKLVEVLICLGVDSQVFGRESL